MKSQNNPFPVIGYKGPEYFCNRKKECEQLYNALQNQRHSLLISIRRLGKTALIHQIFHQIPKQKALCVYCDIQATKNRKEFINTLASSLWQTIPENSSWGKKILLFLKSLRPLITYDELTGKPEISITSSSYQQEETTIQKLLSTLNDFDKPVFIALDEFQQISTYPEANTDALLRSILQSLKKVIFIFAGSQQHILTEMFGSAKRPFFGFTDILRLSYLETTEYTDFIRHHFTKNHYQIGEDALSFILTWTRNHTYYTQYLCNRIFAGNSSTIITIENVMNICNQIILEHEPIFFSYQKLITQTQWKLLVATAAEQQLFAPTSGGIMQKYKLGSPSSVNRSLNALIDKELIFTDFTKSGESFYTIYNVFFSHWLEKFR